jgi:4-diphosphocytidyl-2-C-methyl-D-erythritol kinase
MNASTSYKSPAKLNLFLHVCGRRDDGYHNLQTVFQFLDFSDDLHFSPNNSGEIILENAIAGVAHDNNLIVRAAKLLAPYQNERQGVRIQLEKRLPMGAGLGGGSSNAATTLVALNQLWQCGLSKAALQTLGLSLGADVPIFIYGHAAFAEGIGEQLQNIDAKESVYLLAIPNCHVSTEEIFSHSRLTRDSKMMKIAAFLEQGNLLSLLDTRNDCEVLVRSLYPEVAETFVHLAALGLQEPARMTGTGACVFVRFDNYSEALAAQQQLDKYVDKPFKTVVCQGANQSPLYT